MYTHTERGLIDVYTHIYVRVYTHIGLIDFGQVKRLTRAKRLQLCKLIIALDNHDQGTLLTLPKPEALSPNTLTLLNLKPLRYLTSLSHFAYFAFAVFVSFFFSVFACFHDNQFAQDQVVELFVEMGCRTQKMDKKVIKKKNLKWAAVRRRWTSR